MRVDELRTDYHLTEGNLRQAKHFREVFFRSVNGCDDKDYKLANLIADWEKASNPVLKGNLCKYVEDLLEPQFRREILEAFEDLKNAFITRAEFKKTVAPYSGAFTRAVKEAQENYEEAKNKVVKAYCEYVESRFKEEKNMITLLESEPIMSACLGFIFQP